jgi:hypothetical protein
MFYHEAEKILALRASRERIARNHQFERTTNRISLFCTDLGRVFELMPS